MPEINTTIDVEIPECGAGLCGNVSYKGRSGNEFYIEPCEKCMKKKYEEGHGKGIGEI